MAILSKYVNQITKSHNSLKLVFTNTGGLGSNFVGFQFSLESDSPNICVVCETNSKDSVVSRNLLCMVHVPLVGKDSVTHMLICSCSFCEGQTPFCTGFISRKLKIFLFLLLTDFTSFSVVSLFLSFHGLHFKLKGKFLFSSHNL